MKRQIARILLSVSLLLATVCFAASALLQLPKITSRTALARNSPAQDMEAVRDALERAINDARANPSEKQIAAVDAAFQNYLIVVSAQETKILDRINDLEALIGILHPTSGHDGGADPQKPKSGAETERLQAEYRELSAQLESLRSDFGAANVEVSKIVASRGQANISAAAGTCKALIVQGTDPSRVATVTDTLSGMITQIGGSVMVSDGVPDLAPFSVVYDIGFKNTLSATDKSAYRAFLQRGGKLLLVGEKKYPLRNSSIISFVDMAGGGFLVFCTTGCTSCVPTCGDPVICPPGAKLKLPKPGGTTGSGTGTALLTLVSGCRPASVFRPHQLANALPGTLIIFFDFNTFEPKYGVGNDNQRLIGNIVSFFCPMCFLFCPANITVTSSVTCSFATVGTMVTYPTPVGFGCGPITCHPPPGLFPVGVTTVTCTAATLASCSFTVTVFNGCLEDSSGNVALFNTQTGEYRICCNGQKFTGRGAPIVAGCLLTIQEITPSSRVSISLNGIAHTGTAVVESPPGTIRCLIGDTATTNNNCACQ